MLHADVLGERARLTPGRTALVFVPTGGRFTYEALDLRAARLAQAWLARLGLTRGDRIGLLAHNCPEFIDAFFAAAKSGVILVPLSTRATTYELTGIVADSGMRALMYGPGFLEAVTKLRAGAPLETCIALDPHERSVPEDQALSALIDDIVPGGQPVSIDPEHPLCLLYTSGTTGKPKGVIVPHRMVAWNAYNTTVCWQLREDDVSPVFTPLYHAGGLGAFLLPIFAAGGTIVLHAGFDPGEIWRVIEAERCTVALGVPTIYKLLMDDPGFASADLSHVRWLISGGAPLPRHLIDAYQARGVAFKQGYGLTEVGVNCFAMSVDESVTRAGSIGKPLMFTRARLADERGEDVPVGDVGELWLKGPHVCRGYWNNPEATAQALDADGWFHTGDLARQDADGFYYIAGRKKDMIISGGVNIYPAEIEQALAAHPGVADSAVVGIPDDTWGEVSVAFVVRAPGSPVDAAELSSYLLGVLSRFKVPKSFEFVERLPRTPYGKVVKDELRARHLDTLADRGAARHES